MADYNVQMKQYNGTSFDNILPYASQALTLAGGGGATEIIAQARAGLSQIATGSYVGTGTYGASNPNTLQIGFKVKLLIIRPISTSQSTSSGGYDYFYEDPPITYLGLTKNIVDNNLPLYTWPTAESEIVIVNTEQNDFVISKGRYSFSVGSKTRYSEYTSLLHFDYGDNSVSFYNKTYQSTSSDVFSSMKTISSSIGQLNENGVKYQWVAFG